MDAGAAREEERWELTVTPLAWAAEQRGTLVVRGVEASADVDLSDLLSALDLVASVGFELRKGDFALQADGLYLDIEEEVEPRLLETDVGLRQVLAQTFLTYRVLSEPVSLEVVAGARYARIDVDIDFARLPSDVDRTRDWVDPLVGLRVRKALTDGLVFSFRSDVGGFGVGSGSDRVWSVNGTFVYGLGDRWDLSFGYNLLSYDYDAGSGPDRFEYNVMQRGPILGISHRF